MGLLLEAVWQPPEIGSRMCAAAVEAALVFHLDISPSPKHAINTDKKKFLFPGSTFFFPLEYKQKNGNKYE